MYEIHRGEEEISRMSVFIFIWKQASKSYYYSTCETLLRLLPFASSGHCHLGAGGIPYLSRRSSTQREQSATPPSSVYFSTVCKYPANLRVPSSLQQLTALCNDLTILTPIIHGRLPKRGAELQEELRIFFFKAENIIVLKSADLFCSECLSVECYLMNIFKQIFNLSLQGKGDI